MHAKFQIQLKYLCPLYLVLCRFYFTIEETTEVKQSSNDYSQAICLTWCQTRRFILVLPVKRAQAINHTDFAEYISFAYFRLKCVAKLINAFQSWPECGDQTMIILDILI